MNNLELINNYIKELDADKFEFDNTVDIEYNNLMKAHHACKHLESKKKAGVIKIDYDIVEYYNTKYIVCKIKYKEETKLFVVDYKNFDKIKYLEWHTIPAGYITTYFKIKRSTIVIFLHNLIMNKITFNGKGQHLTVDHINRVPSDNRKVNLRIINQSEQNFNRIRNEKKIILPDNCNINADDIPRCVTYRKIRGTHGECFEILISNFNGKNLQWTTATSITLSLKFKFEHAKKYLRYLKETYPDEFNKHHIEKNYNDQEVELIDSYNKILEMSKFSTDHTKIIPNNKNYLDENLTGLSDYEIQTLNNCKFDGKNKKLKSSLPINCGITDNMLPIYCHYKPKKKNSGEKFIIRKNPMTKQNFYWATTADIDVNLKEKFNQLIEKYNTLLQ